MQISKKHFLFVTITAMVFTLSACGGSRGSFSDTQMPVTASPTAMKSVIQNTPTCLEYSPNGTCNVTELPSRTDAQGNVTLNLTASQVGKEAFQNSCAMCHSTQPADNVNNILTGANSVVAILDAVNNGVGGMETLRDKISASEASDIAAYLATPNV